MIRYRLLSSFPVYVLRPREKKNPVELSCPSPIKPRISSYSSPYRRMFWSNIHCVYPDESSRRLSSEHAGLGKFFHSHQDSFSLVTFCWPERLPLENHVFKLKVDRKLKEWIRQTFDHRPVLSTTIPSFLHDKHAGIRELLTLTTIAGKLKLLIVMKFVHVSVE